MLKRMERNEGTFHVLAEGICEKYAYFQNNVEVGIIHLVINEKDHSIHIDYFEIKEPFRLQGIGKQMLHQLLRSFPRIRCFWGRAEEDVLTYFWSKQEGYECKGEWSEDYEGYFLFELNRK